MSTTAVQDFFAKLASDQGLQEEIATMLGSEIDTPL
jgi:hypothetical protein